MENIKRSCDDVGGSIVEVAAEEEILETISSGSAQPFRQNENGQRVPIDVDGNAPKENFILDESVKRALIDLQRHWVTNYRNCREKNMIEIVEKVCFSHIFYFLG